MVYVTPGIMWCDKFIELLLEYAGAQALLIEFK
jgi:hypothetical protein